MSNSLKKLYHKIILERQRDLAGFEKREDADLILEAYNPLCGDKFMLYLDFQGDVIRRANYYGYGCALSKASTSLLIEGLPGKNLDDCQGLIESYFENLKEANVETEEIIKALSMARNFPGREQCVVLSWQTVLEFIKDKSNK